MTVSQFAATRPRNWSRSVRATGQRPLGATGRQSWTSPQHDRQAGGMEPKQLPPFGLVLQPLSDEAQALLLRPSYVDPAVGTRHRLGGAPDLPRGVDWPSCPQGDGAMSFYAQLDGVPAATEFDLADSGLIFVFVCFDCFEVQALLHSA
jgi:hypothetical protein